MKLKDHRGIRYPKRMPAGEYAPGGPLVSDTDLAHWRLQEITSVQETHVSLVVVNIPDGSTRTLDITIVEPGVSEPFAQALRDNLGKTLEEIGELEIEF